MVVEDIRSAGQVSGNCASRNSLIDGEPADNVAYAL